MSIKNINVISELESCGWHFKWSTENNILCRCPFHSDKTPSCFIDVEERIFFCQSSECNAKGDIITFLAKLLQTNRALIIQDLSKRYHIDSAKTINADVIERYHQRIDNAGPLKKELYNRGVTDKLIRKYRIGENDNRITIPIKNASGMFVNVRKYLPGAPGDRKMRNTRGHGQIRLFPVEQLKYDRLMLAVEK